MTLKVVRKPPVILKIVPKAGYELYSGEIQPMRVNEGRSRYLLLLAEQSLELVSVFKEASRNFTCIFLFNNQV